MKNDHTITRSPGRKIWFNNPRLDYSLQSGAVGSDDHVITCYNHVWLIGSWFSRFWLCIPCTLPYHYPALRSSPVLPPARPSPCISHEDIRTLFILDLPMRVPFFYPFFRPFFPLDLDTPCPPCAEIHASCYASAPNHPGDMQLMMAEFLAEDHGKWGKSPWRTMELYSWDMFENPMENHQKVVEISG